MVWFKCGLIFFPSTLIFSICSQIASESRVYNIGLVFLYVASAAIAGKIVYDRHQLINILGSLTNNPNVTSFTNKIASICVSLLFLGFPVYFLMTYFNVDNYCVTALNICLCALATLYMWMQGLVTVYFTPLYFDRSLSAVRQCLASFSCVVLLLMAVFGSISTFVPGGVSAGSASHICLYLTMFCSHVVAAISSVFMLSYEKEYTFFGRGSEADIDDTSSVASTSSSDTQCLLKNGGLKSNSMLINSAIFSSKIS